YEDTPLHRANFIMLIKRQYFDEAIFYRVVEGFVIQGGDTDDEERLALRQEIGAYYVPAEFHAHHYHRKGMLAMARNYTDNPDKKSSPYIFYIVHGTKATPAELDAVQAENGHAFPAAHRSYYTSAPGTPHLDGEHTVFGEVVEGLDVIDSIAAVKVDGGDWPINNVVMDIEILE
ncbi:MAG: peptidylprolyl isomerase, partial [Bacteroidota bacterium]